TPTSAGRPRCGPRPLDEPLVLEVSVPQPGEALPVLQHPGPHHHPPRLVHGDGLVGGADVVLGEADRVELPARPHRARSLGVAHQVSMTSGMKPGARPFVTASFLSPGLQGRTIIATARTTRLPYFLTETLHVRAPVRRPRPGPQQLGRPPQGQEAPA